MGVVPQYIVVVNRIFRIYWFLFRIIAFLTHRVKNTIMGLFSLPESTQNQLFKQNSITDFAHPIYIRLSIICVYLFAMSFGLTTNFQNSKPLQLASSLSFSVVFICGIKKLHFPTLFSDIIFIKNFAKNPVFHIAF